MVWLFFIRTYMCSSVCNGSLQGELSDCEATYVLLEVYICALCNCIQSAYCACRGDICEGVSVVNVERKSKRFCALACRLVGWYFDMLALKIV